MNQKTKHPGQAREIEISQLRLHQVLGYDQETGIFTWRARLSNRAQIGSVAGTVKGNGYIGIQIDGKIHMANRLAWIFVTGQSAKGDVDHIDGNPSNNAFSNLRDSTRAQNLANQKLRSNNTTGLKGAYLCRHIIGSRRWESKIMSNGVTYHGGMHKTIEEAAEASRLLRIKHHGEFARNN